jgi:hypothetical protein
MMSDAHKITQERNDDERQQRVAIRREEKISMKSQNVWESILQQVRPRINEQSFNTWLVPTRLNHNGDSKLSVFVPNREFQEKILEDYQRKILEEAAKLGITQVTYVPEEVPSPAPALAPEPEPEPEIPVLSRAAPTIPEECWRGIFADYREIARKAGEAPDSFHFAGIAAALSASLGRSVCMQDPVEVFPNLFLCVVGEAGCGKSEPERFAIERVLRPAVPETMVMTSLDSGQGLVSTIKRRKAKSPSVVIALTEIRSLIDKVAQKASGDLVPKLNDLYDCKNRLEINTKNSYEEVDEVPPGVFLAATTPEWMENVKKEDLTGGLGSRILFIPGDPRADAWPGRQDFTPISLRLKDTAAFWRSRGQSELRFDADADQLYREWHKKRPTLNCKHRLIRSLSVRHRSYVLKFASLYAADEHSDRIRASHLEPATMLMDQFAFPSLWHLFSDFNLSPFGKLEQKIIDVVKSTPGRRVRKRYLLLRFANWQYERWMVRRALENVSGRFADDPSWDGDLRLVTAGRKHYVEVNDE